MVRAPVSETQKVMKNTPTFCVLYPVRQSCTLEGANIALKVQVNKTELNSPHKGAYIW